MFNVARFLPDFFESLESQSIGFARIQVILVDDGSTDESLPLARAFARRHAQNVIVLSQANGGQASARNRGLTVATGVWLTFPDPDDKLSRTYFEECERALASVSAADVDVVSARILMWYGGNRVRDSHALAARFHGGVTLQRLESEPEWIQPHATSALVRRKVVEQFSLVFPERLRIRFEDGCFISDYLLHVDDPSILFVPRACYFYRQRSDQSSTVQSTKSDPRKYVDHLKYGFPYLVSIARGSDRGVPRWLQNLMLYDQFWILLSSQSGGARRARLPQAVHDELVQLLAGFLVDIDEEAIGSFALMPTPHSLRDALLVVKRAIPHGPVREAAHDPLRGLRAYTYVFGDEPGDEQIFVGDDVIAARFTKQRGIEYVGRTIAWERTIWVPDDAEIRVVLDGVVHTVASQQSGPQSPFVDGRLQSGRVGARLVTTTLRRCRRIAAAVYRRRGRRGIELIRRRMAMHSKTAARRFVHAWVFMDRDSDANDSGEDVYFWVTKHHPEVNSWFVVRRESPDWKRLERKGARLIAYGEPAFYALLAHADHLASSHADRFVTDVLPRRMRGRYTFTFLQHGVIKGDISEWLNKKKIDVFVTSTQDEYDYLTGPSPYKFGAKEVRLTGLPRHDVLLEKAAAVESPHRRTILIAPTWRDYLVGDMTTSSTVRERVSAFGDSTYAAQWRRMLHSATLERLASRGFDVVFMPHPNMAGYLADLTAPRHVRQASYADTDIRELLADAVLLVTDYSSVAFNAAFLRVPVVYFQFDRDEYLDGHTEREGYFDYVADGFGPVCTDVDSVSGAIAAAIDEGVESRYLSRMHDAFPVRDGRNRQRVFTAMVEARTRRDAAERRTSAPRDSWE